MALSPLTRLGLLAPALLASLSQMPDPLAGIDIEREYELIQQKRSNLPRSKRDLVVSRYRKLHGGSNCHA